VRRREFIAGLGGAAAWPLAARAQQSSIPVIGYLDSGSRTTGQEVVALVNRGLAEIGYVEGRNLAVEYRWAEDHYDRLPGLAADLVGRQVAVIVAPGSTPAALAAKAATNSIPIVFQIGNDPVEIGLVASLNRPGGNVTGISFLNKTVAAKRLQLMHELVPAVTSIAALFNPSNAVGAETQTRELQAAARTLGVHLLILNASDESEFDAAFATLVGERAGGLLVGGDTLFFHHSNKLVALAARHRVPAMFPYREVTAAGGLMSYGGNITDLYRQVGSYTGRILRGEKPADLPVQQTTKFELVFNVKTAKALGLTIPETLLATADEVIE
jgi:putative tryptophan/tyrosine transport system substrate-binding protein